MAELRLNQLRLRKDNIAQLPIIGAALAIAYDVGYFIGIDLSYFTFFSLSEHIVFAFQALPVVVIALALIGVCLSLSENVPKRFETPIYYSGLVIVIFAGILFTRESYVAFVIALLIGSALTAFLSKLYFSGISRIFLFAVILVVDGMAVGRSASILHLSDKSAQQKIHIKNTGETTAIFIRSGERGLLFYVPETHAFQFREWSQIIYVEKVRYFN